jgi:hypothetical protein
MADTPKECLQAPETLAAFQAGQSACGALRIGFREQLVPSVLLASEFNAKKRPFIT